MKKNPHTYGHIPSISGVGVYEVCSVLDVLQVFLVLHSVTERLLW